MASARYTLNIKPDAPEEPPKPMTRRQKWDNFWFYHKWHVIIGVAAALMAGLLVKDVVTKVEPDYTIGVLTTQSLPYSADETLGEKLATLCDDRNGDGKVEVQVLEYWITEDAIDPNTQMAMITKLMGDMQTGESMLFLTDDVAVFEEKYGIFAYNDGTAPEDFENADITGMGVAWEDCPALTALELGEYQGQTLMDDSTGSSQEYLKKFYVGRRGVWDPRQAEKFAGCADFWNVLTAGAAPMEGQP